MDDFDVLELAIEAATKHGKHNQKLHGRRFGPDTGGGGGSAVFGTPVPMKKKKKSGGSGGVGGGGTQMSLDDALQREKAISDLVRDYQKFRKSQKFSPFSVNPMFRDFSAVATAVREVGTARSVMDRRYKEKMQSAKSDEERAKIQSAHDRLAQALKDHDSDFSDLVKKHRSEYETIDKELNRVTMNSYARTYPPPGRPGEEPDHYYETEARLVAEQRLILDKVKPLIEAEKNWDRIVGKGDIGPNISTAGEW